MRVVPSILSGKAVVSKSLRPVLSPTNSPLHNYSPIEKAWLPQICQDSMAGFHTWRGRSFGERARILFAAADIVEKNEQVYVAAHMELGSGEHFALVGVKGAVANIREYALKVLDPAGAVLNSADTKLAFSVKTPVGPVLSMASWNAPVILAARAIAAPLAAGCSVLVKANEKAPKVPALLVQHFLDAGVDPAALQLIHAEPDEHAAVTDSLLENPNIKMVNFTGSTEVGRNVALLAARNLKPALLELGGKNVCLVLKDADLAQAAASVVFSAWLHMGQICMCLDWVYVHEDVYDEFRDLLKKAAKKVLHDSSFLYALRDETGAEKIQALVKDALLKGARELIRAGSKPEPLVLEGITDSMDIFSQETFGPVLALEKFKDLDEAVNAVNSSKYGLKASVWSENTLAAVDVAKRLDAGGVHINSSTVHDEPTIPHGGVKESGAGRFNSTWGIEQFTYTKAITVS